ncbi:VOC family protein [Variovorax sp. E3]|uniref:VOC family protein n=1 Tax=Variovorax sp. E3 TaxID=1914993 RepID=UPI0022B7334F|nr:VOC family protein [Variovorax sp. E3]
MKKHIRIGRAPIAPREGEKSGSEESLSCPKPWDALEETAAPGVRYCSDCLQNVFEADTTEQVREAALQHRCVAVAQDSAYFRERNDTMSPSPTARRLATVTLLVRDYDEAIRFFTEALRFELVEDTPRGPGKRWVVVAPARNAGAALLLAKAVTDDQEAVVGKQAGGRVFLFLQTSDFASDHAHMAAHGVRFLEAPRHEPHGIVAVFQDLCGNKWDLIQPGDA